MKKIIVLILVFHVFSYVYGQNTEVIKKNDGLKISLKTENLTWIKDIKMPVTIKITNYTKSEIKFDSKLVRFQLSPIKGGFTKTFIVPTDQTNDDKFIIKIKSGETIFQTFDLLKLSFLEFESTNSGRTFGEIPKGKYRLKVILEKSAEVKSSILVNFASR